jgi:hypothetical protein
VALVEKVVSPIRGEYFRKHKLKDPKCKEEEEEEEEEELSDCSS